MPGVIIYESREWEELGKQEYMGHIFLNPFNTP